LIGYPNGSTIGPANAASETASVDPLARLRISALVSESMGARPDDRETRKLAAILVSDIVGYSRLAGADEDRTLSRLRGLRSDLIDPAIAAHRGRVVKRTGDGSIIEFRSVVNAVRCAIEVQNGLIERNAGVPEGRWIQFRVGIHLGDVVEEADGDLMGDGVNIAAARRCLRARCDLSF
jgi:class 3 adenylate cyclase